ERVQDIHLHDGCSSATAVRSGHVMLCYLSGPCNALSCCAIREVARSDNASLIPFSLDTLDSLNNGTLPPRVEIREHHVISSVQENQHSLHAVIIYRGAHCSATTFISHLCSHAGRHDPNG
ncbi:unnamed protein product, partial [Ectocarpus sp. 4 AP-2014]